MKAVKGDRVKIINKMNDWSSDYEEGDIFTVESTWYGGINVTSSTGIPLSIDEVEYEILKNENQETMIQKVIFHVDSSQGVTATINYAEELCKTSGKWNIEILAVHQAVKSFLSTEDSKSISDLHSKGVKFLLCKKSIEEFDVKPVDLLSFVTVVSFGVLTLIEKQSSGYAYIRV